MSFESILIEIYELRKDHFDKSLKQFLNPPSDCVEFVFDDDDDEFETLLEHFDAILKVKN